MLEQQPAHLTKIKCLTPCGVGHFLFMKKPSFVDRLLALGSFPRVVALALAAISVAIGVAIPKSPRLNKYQHAQRATLLVEASTGYGTGFVVQRGNKLFVWTANHVIGNDNEVKIRSIIRFASTKVGESTFAAKVIARDAAMDIALLHLEAPPSYFESVTFGPIAAADVGTEVYHVGNFFGPALDNSVSTGIVSQVGVSDDSFSWQWIIADQASCAIVSGSSGGPIFSGDGKVIGVAVARRDVASFFVPVRALAVFAEANNVRFALDADEAPSYSKLNALANRAALTKVLPHRTITR